MKELISQNSLGDMEVIYIKEAETQIAGLVMLPKLLKDQFTLEGAWTADSLIQVKVAGDVNPVGFSHGHSMRNSGTTQVLAYERQLVKIKETDTSIRTVLSSNRLEAVHTLTYRQGDPYVRIVTEIKNKSMEEIAVEMISSFSLCGFSPIEEQERMEDFNLYRLQSKWSAEGRLEKQNFTELLLEPSWQRYGAASVRFGQVGSMPVRRFFPWVAVEDEKYGYLTGAQLYHAGSWQIEIYTRDDRAAISGGLADREFGHWMKCLKPGEKFKTPEAVLTVCMGNVDDVSWRLTSAQRKALEEIPECERELPVLFNEFCTTWGNPTQENLLNIVDVIKGKGFRYCVIDAGWYAIGADDWNGDMGDWNINQERFPGGFARTVQAIREAGMIPGLWFEMECVGCNALSFHRKEWQLKRDGYPIQTGSRRFWDMRKPQVIDYLTEKVIGILKQYDFGYLKVDYNDNIGIGCDGAESLGEGLRQYVEASQHFFQRIREEIPGIVIENCSSGGHRLEPSMMALTSMASFSDAHECTSIPVIAANVQRAVLPCQSQIWAVLRREDSEKRLYYSIINTFLGRMCLSGDIDQLSRGQWQIVEQGIEFYNRVKEIIKDGISYRFGEDVGNYNHPAGWQAVLRQKINPADGKKAGMLLAIVHRFHEKGKEEYQKSKNSNVIELSLPEGNWQITDRYGRKKIKSFCHRDRLVLQGMEEFDGVSVVLKRLF